MKEQHDCKTAGQMCDKNNWIICYRRRPEETRSAHPFFHVQDIWLGCSRTRHCHSSCRSDYIREDDKHQVTIKDTRTNEKRDGRKVVFLYSVQSVKDIVERVSVEQMTVIRGSYVTVHFTDFVVVVVVEINQRVIPANCIAIRFLNGSAPLLQHLWTCSHSGADMSLFPPCRDVLEMHI